LRRGFPGVARVDSVKPASLGDPPSVFNKNSSLKEHQKIYARKDTSAVPKLDFQKDTHFLENST